MRITIIGNGNVGAGLARTLGRTQHEVSTLGKDDDIGAAVRGADVVVLATPFDAATDVVGKTDLSGKIIVDVTNPITEDFSGLKVGHETSAAEEIARAAPGATVVKAFNTVFAQHYAGDLRLGGVPLQTFIASDDETARETVKALAAEAGFEPVDAGPLRNARYLEPLGFMNIQFGYVLGRGTGIAPRWQAAA